MKPISRLAGLVLSAVFLLSALDGRYAVAQSTVGPPMRTKRDYLSQQGPTQNQAAYPHMSKDFLTALETLGVRPGMILTAARAEAAKWGARLEKADDSNLSEIAKPSPANVYQRESIARAFTYNSVPDADYRGHPRNFDPDAPNKNWLFGVTQVLVFPADPLGDLYDPANLIVYYVNSSVMFNGRRTRQDGVMSREAFFSQGEKRVGQTLHTAMSANRADCGYAIVDYVQRVMGLAGVAEPRVPDHLSAWKQCGQIALVRPSLAGSNLFGYRIDYADAALAERAFGAFRVYGSEQPRGH